ncbi:MAG: hypothetical protein J6B11_04585 [Spirochaetales bacterium]|nr:hypothetical protein [Spirochaetales bacterium]
MKRLFLMLVLVFLSIEAFAYFHPVCQNAFILSKDEFEFRGLAGFAMNMGPTSLPPFEYSSPVISTREIHLSISSLLGFQTRFRCSSWCEFQLRASNNFCFEMGIIPGTFLWVGIVPNPKFHLLQEAGFKFKLFNSKKIDGALLIMGGFGFGRERVWEIQFSAPWYTDASLFVSPIFTIHTLGKKKLREITLSLPLSVRANLFEFDNNGNVGFARIRRSIPSCTAGISLGFDTDIKKLKYHHEVFFQYEFTLFTSANGETANVLQNFSYDYAGAENIISIGYQGSIGKTVKLKGE